jgi:acetyl esterase/lipase
LRGPAAGLRVRAVVEALLSLRGPAHFPEPRPTARGVVYRAGPRRGVPPLADLYVPAESAREASGASAVLVHGGAFVVGSRAMKPMRYLASRLVAAGIAVCSIDYRLVFRGGRIDEATDDVIAAVEFWRARSREHGLDPTRISLVGLSAGGTLAMLAASRLGPAGLHRLVSVFGLLELDHLRGPLATLVPRLVFRTKDRASWQARSPRGIAQPEMSTLLLHGTADGLVPVEQARRLAAHRESLGLPTKLVVYEGAPHGFFNAPSEACDAGAREIITHVSA